MWLGREIWVYLQKDLTATYRGANEYNRRVDMEGFQVSDTFKSVFQQDEIIGGTGAKQSWKGRSKENGISTSRQG